jgi:tol-pal system protein YbgF
MKYTVLPLALMISMFSAAEDGWVAVGQVPAAKPAVKSVPAVSQHSNSTSPTSSIYPAKPPLQAEPSLQVELLTMVEMMQQEIAELRGTVEEQNHKIEILQKQQQQRYLDLDRRMTELLGQPTAVIAPNGAPKANVLPADDLYASAMSFIKKKDFTQALEQLDLFAKTYPQHALAANAFYWSGEVQLAEGNFALAIKQFETVVSQHPNHNKAADSHYKLAVSYDRSGNAVKAKQILQQVIKQYPGTSDSAVRLAERYLARLKAAEA